ncbi:rna-directed dna polymerase from mobile element jockey- hypothetical protein [Limosa lapponica baueri]|uniref:Reverse transcriptase domain-containing protein n=1 Tax=Limosa lapponica baueri TaxID=1758121 RepID=A0A2I0TQI6_LIMLA|nr:rna-directed dna polymerase from mobile element jockey- hypothetical protein [Limosa lapponica baueri]
MTSRMSYSITFPGMEETPFPHTGVRYSVGLKEDQCCKCLAGSACAIFELFSIPVFKKGKEDLGNYRLVGLTSIPGKMIEQLVLDVISKHMEEKKAIRSSQHGFTKGKSCLTNLIAFYDGMIGWTDEESVVDVVYLDFSKTFDTVSHCILIGKLRKCGIDEWTVRWIENWLKDRVQRVVISGTV